MVTFINLIHLWKYSPRLMLSAFGMRLRFPQDHPCFSLCLYIWSHWNSPRASSVCSGFWASSQRVSPPRSLPVPNHDRDTGNELLLWRGPVADVPQCSPVNVRVPPQSPLVGVSQESPLSCLVLQSLGDLSILSTWPRFLQASSPKGDLTNIWFSCLPSTISPFLWCQPVT